MATVFTFVFLLIFLAHPVFMSEMVDKWITTYKNTMIQAMQCKEGLSTGQYRSCFENYPSMNPNSSQYITIDDSYVGACCDIEQLRYCLKKVLVEDGSSENQAEELSYLLTKLWSSNDAAKCKKLGRSSNPCLIHYNRTTIYVGIAIFASLVFGTPLTYLLVKYGLRWYCCGRGPNLHDLRSHLSRTLLNNEGGSLPTIT